MVKITPRQEGGRARKGEEREWGRERRVEGKAGLGEIGQELC